MPELRKAYQAHVEKMLSLAGEKPEQAKKDAETVMKIETTLAQASMPRVDRRDPNKVYHRLDLAGIPALAEEHLARDLRRRAGRRRQGRGRFVHARDDNSSHYIRQSFSGSISHSLTVS